jgi:glutaredoxin
LKYFNQFCLFVLLAVFGAAGSQSEAQQARCADPNIVRRDAAETTGKLPGADAPARNAHIEIFTMSTCDHGIAAVKALNRLAVEFGDRLSLQYYYMVDKDAEGKFTSPYGAPDLEEDLREICVARLYGEKIIPYIESKHVADHMPLEEIVKAQSLCIEDIEACMKAEGLEFLARGYQRERKLNVTMVPTIYINGRRFDRHPDEASLRFAICRGIADAGTVEACAKAGSCMTDADCTSGGNSGICVSPGMPESACSYEKVPSSSYYLITDRSAVIPYAGMAAGSPKFILPGGELKELDCDSPEGRDMIARYNIRRVPAFVFNFGSVGAASGGKFLNSFTVVGGKREGEDSGGEETHPREGRSVRELLFGKVEINP